MGKVRKTPGKRGGKASNEPKKIAPEMFKDNKAENLLSFKTKTYAGVSKGNKTRNRSVDQGRTQRAKPKQRTYTEKELGIPKLNKALDPVGVAVKGKKGKKFVTDSKMLQIIAEVNEETNAVNASKLEKARQLEEIREAKRKEYEEKEQAKKEKLDSKKKQAKSKSKKTESNLDDKPVRSEKKRKVRFA